MKGTTRKWCEAHLFGNRRDPKLQGVFVPLTSTQEAVKRIAVEIIMKWEKSHAR
jgi:hypothetical protein